MALQRVTLDDKYDLTRSRVFVTGYQALVRMCLMQKERDRRAKLNTAGYITGYRGSPLGGLDYQFQRAEALCRQNDILFKTAITEAARADPEAARRIVEHIPAARWGEAADLMGAVVFLASRASDYVNGHVLVVDGGYLVR